MERVCYLKNTDGTNGTSGINLNGFDLEYNELYHITAISELHDITGLDELKTLIENNRVTVYDQKEIVMSLQEYENFSNYYKNTILSRVDKSQIYKLYFLLSDDTYNNINAITETPKSIDYKKDVYQRMHPQYTFKFGFLVKVEYFAFSDIEGGIQNFVNPVLSVEFEYHIATNGYVSYRIAKREWQTLDGNYSTDTKVCRKVYNTKQAREEGIRRRNNIINETVINAVGLILMFDPSATTVQEAEDSALPILDAMNSEIDKYIKGNTQPLVDAMTNADPLVHTWLDINIGGPTIRQYLIAELSEAERNDETIDIYT